MHFTEREYHAVMTDERRLDEGINYLDEARRNGIESGKILGRAEAFLEAAQLVDESSSEVIKLMVQRKLVDAALALNRLSLNILSKS